MHVGVEDEDRFFQYGRLGAFLFSFV